MKLINLIVLALLPALTLADEWIWAPDFSEGAELPDFTVQAGGAEVSLSEMAGEQGTLLMFSRSTVW